MVQAFSEALGGQEVQPHQAAAIAAAAALVARIG
jgi:hypothetical protein